MAGSREAQFKRGTIEARTLYGWQIGVADGYDCEVEGFAELELSYYRLTKREEKRLCLAEAEGDSGFTPVSEVSSGKPLVPEKQRLAEIIDRLNDLYGAEVSDDDKLHFASGIERDEALTAQVHHQSEYQVMHGLSPSSSSTLRSHPCVTTRSSACPCWKMRRQRSSLCYWSEATGREVEAGNACQAVIYRCISLCPPSAPKRYEGMDKRFPNQKVRFWAPYISLGTMLRLSGVDSVYSILGRLLSFLLNSSEDVYGGFSK